tara:strand:+ start:951 stop:1370 length:420 start_codon:yes stop_codon:yes gene_type:complete
MKHLLILIIIPFLSFGQQDMKKIKNVLLNQEKAWNKGNVREFMLGYWDSEKLEFNSDGRMTYGWTNTFMQYSANYPTKDKMGKLTFQIIDIELISDTTALVNGEWELIRTSDSPKGNFLLTFKKFNDKWLIIKDYTKSE